MFDFFGKRKLVRDISANTVQTGITQVFGIIIFYYTSKYLSKTEFGEFNWSMAIGATVIAIASLGLDLIYVKKLAVRENVLIISGIHFFHTVIVGLLVCGAAYLGKLFLPNFEERHPIFLFVIIYLAVANIANSFKLCLNGLEAYPALAKITLVSNFFKLIFVLVLFYAGSFSIYWIIAVYLATSVLEFCLAYIMVTKTLAVRIKPVIKVFEYKYFVLEALPQLGVVLFDSALARIDWILLGIITTASVTAEYSFVYKIFELSKLPLLIIAPVLLTRFSKLFADGRLISETEKNKIVFFFKVEMFLIMLIPIILATTWTPLIDYFTAGKYGAVNRINYLILAFCVPLHAVINFLWTIAFVQGQLKKILVITVAVSVLNILSNAALIPLYGATGSAISFLICTLIQLMLYRKYVDLSQIRPDLFNILISFGSAVTSVLVATLLINNIIFGVITALAIHVCITFISKQISITQIKNSILNR